MVQVLLKDKNRHILIMSRDLNKLVLDILLNINFSLSFKHRHRCVNDTLIDILYKVRLYVGRFLQGQLFYCG